jgi:hypothetical protein
VRDEPGDGAAAAGRLGAALQAPWLDWSDRSVKFLNEQREVLCFAAR